LFCSLEGALLLCGVAQRPLPVYFSVNWCQNLVNAALCGGSAFFRIPGRSISSAAWAVPDQMAAQLTASQQVGYLRSGSVLRGELVEKAIC